MSASQTLPILTNLEAGFVPHRLWPLRKWYYANPLWFYHEPYAADDMIPSPTFYELVDPELRDLCRGLHRAGLHTTPSCQGHFYGRDRFLLIWDELVRERQKIRAGGLIVEDSETQQEYRFEDRQFALPWDSFEEFHEEASAQQSVGYIGILVPPERLELLDSLERLPGRSREMTVEFDDEIGGRLGASLLAIRVRPVSPEARSRIWQRITRDLLGAVSGTRALASAG